MWNKNILQTIGNAPLVQLNRKKNDWQIGLASKKIFGLSLYPAGIDGLYIQSLLLKTGTVEHGSPNMMLFTTGDKILVSSR
jgi:hypothetical protein